MKFRIEWASHFYPDGTRKPDHRLPVNTMHGWLAKWRGTFSGDERLRTKGMTEMKTAQKVKERQRRQQGVGFWSSIFSSSKRKGSHSRAGVTYRHRSSGHASRRGGSQPAYHRRGSRKPTSHRTAGQPPRRAPTRSSTAPLPQYRSGRGRGSSRASSSRGRYGHRRSTQ
ncbi:hypothetical protein DL96DRAFT_1592658 [Flagelloscypha sp. PMI_526]|nr:hypothetical protein DL96DRAFT_1592658 [Flagelloscypha sp. PMI_526]